MGFEIDPLWRIVHLMTLATGSTAVLTQLKRYGGDDAYVRRIERMDLLSRSHLSHPQTMFEQHRAALQQELANVVLRFG